MILKPLSVSLLLLGSVYACDQEFDARYDASYGLDVLGFNRPYDAIRIIRQHVNLGQADNLDLEEAKQIAVELKRDESLTRRDPLALLEVGLVLCDMGAREEAIDILTYLLTLDMQLYGASIPHACLKLYQCGLTETAKIAIRDVIDNSALSYSIRRSALNHFYQMNKHEHRDEAIAKHVEIVLLHQLARTFREAYNMVSPEYVD